MRKYFTVIIVNKGIGKWFENVAECSVFRAGDNIRVVLQDSEGDTLFSGFIERDEELRFDYTPLTK